MTRTHTCGELTKKDVRKEVVLYGWTQSRRDHGGLIFIDLRDRHGLTQIVFDPSHNKENHKKAEHIGREFVLNIKGKVRDRKQGMINPNMRTGEIEILVDELNIINKAETPPIEVDDRKEANEETRLKYRYLDLRRPIMQERIGLRHKIVTSARDYFNKNGFLEITTPMLVKSTPEGARDYVVPSRVNPGEFYALPQSPQLYKQILMISGCDRYYQTAICLRDEDLRADRQPEHMQFDFEMSFVTSDEIRDFVEGLYNHIFKEVLKIKLEKFPVFSYKESMERFGTDKPDIRFGLELIDVTDIVKKSDFSVFKNAEQIKCLNPEKNLTRKELDKYIEFCQKNGAKGMAWMRVTDKGLESSVVKYFNDEVQKELLEKTKAKKDTVLMFIADKKKKVAEILNLLRLKLRDDLKLVKENDFKLCWVKDFPLFAWNESEERWEPEHHMFTTPKQEFVKDFEKRPGEVIGDLWDLVLNGTEVGSGSIRISSPELQERIMRFIGMTKEEANKKFGFLLEAYKYGAPVHGGMGLGLDRTVALMAGLSDIREIIAFPKNKSAQCPMDGSPSEIDEKQMKELHIKSTVIKKKK
jgi:aspartyl-tRNA synthetase